MDRSRRRTSGTTFTGTLALLLIVCLAECATEQRIISRGSKSSNNIEKINGWRSQRGGSCLSYGHSCWGAHGKRSGKPAAAPDWFLTKLLRRIDSDPQLDHGQQTRNDGAIYQVEVAGDSANDKMGSEAVGIRELRQEPMGKPMLDGDLLTNIKLRQIMREAAAVDK